MVETIGPMVEGAGARGIVVECAHVAGGALGGAAVGFAAGAVGAAVARLGPEAGSRQVAAVGLVVAGGAFVFDLFARGGKLGTSRQTPRAWRYLLPHPTVAFLNGFDLGLGVSTRIYFASFAVTVVAAGLMLDPLLGALIGTTFGASRALTVVTIGRRSGHGAETTDRLIARRPMVKSLNLVALAQFALVLLLQVVV